MNGLVEVERHFLLPWRSVLVWQHATDRALRRVRASNPRDVLDRRHDRIPTRAFDGVTGLSQQPVNVGPMLLNGVAKGLLLLDLCVEASEGFLLLCQSAFKAFDVRGMASTGRGGVDLLKFPSKQGVGIVAAPPCIDGLQHAGERQ